MASSHPLQDPPSGEAVPSRSSWSIMISGDSRTSGSDLGPRLGALIAVKFDPRHLGQYLIGQYPNPPRN